MKREKRLNMEPEALERYRKYKRDWERNRRLTDPEYRAKADARNAKAREKWTNRERQKTYMKTYRRPVGYAEARRKEYDDLKRGPCTDCKTCFEPCQMQWDHVKGEKVTPVSDMVLWDRQKMLDEIAKCELVCANCHALRTYTRGTVKRRNALVLVERSELSQLRIFDTNPS